MKYNWKSSALRAGWVILALLVATMSHREAYAAAPLAMGVTYDPTTTAELNGLWRKVQTKLMPGFNFLCPEWEDLEALQVFEVHMSTREITVPIDINEDGGVSSIEEGGWESYPSSPGVEELSLSFISLNKRFTVTQLAKWLETKDRGALISSQITYQGKKAIEAMAAQYADYFYGFSTAVLALNTTVNGAPVASGTYVLDAGYGQAGITDAAYITRMFKVGERVSAIRAGALVGTGQITAKDAAAGSLDITWAANTQLANNDQIVKGNAMDETITGTDYNKGLVGLLDMLTSASVHSLSSADIPEWDAAHSDSTGGRFNGIRWHKGADEVANKGGGSLTTTYMAQGVYRDMLAYYQTSLRFDDAFAMEADGRVTIKGTDFKKYRRVPPGYVISFDKKSVRRLPSLLDKPKGQVRWADAEKIPDRSAWVIPMNFPCQNVVLNRGNTAIWTGLTEQ